MDTNLDNWTTTWLVMGTLTNPQPQLKVTHDRYGSTTVFWDMGRTDEENEKRARNDLWRKQRAYVAKEYDRYKRGVLGTIWEGTR